MNAHRFAPVAASLALAATLALGAGPCAEKEGATKPGAVLVLKGGMTSEGVECPAFRDEKGTLYTLAGSVGEYRPGDRVCVKGRLAEVSVCQQGMTIAVEWIGPEGECP